MKNLVVNLHLLERCNYRCKHCFGHFDAPSGLLLSSWKLVVDNVMKDNRVTRLNLAGGEPLLFPKIGGLIEYIHNKGAAVSIITNGSLLKKELLQNGNVSMVGISIDSFNKETLRNMGRCLKDGTVLSKREYCRLCGLVKENGIDLKINTVVSRLNIAEDFSPIKEIAPNRWKIIKMQNFINGNFGNSHLGISDKEFADFCERQKSKGVDFVAESTTKNAYIFVDPLGNLLDNSEGRYQSVGNLLKEDFSECFKKLPFDEALYNSRYDA